MAIDMKSLLEDDNFLIGMGLLSAGAKGQSIGEAGITSIKDAAAIKKSLIGKTKDKFRLLSRTEIENNAALDNNSNYQMNMTTGELKIVPINKGSKEKDQFRLLSKEELETNYPQLDSNKIYQINEATNEVKPFKKDPLVKIEGDKQQTEFEKVMGKSEADFVVDVRKDSDKAIDQNSELDIISSLSVELKSGKFGTTMLEVAKIGERVGIDMNWLSDYDGAGTGTVANAEVLQVLSSSMVLNAISKTKGSISDKEMSFFQSIAPNLGMSPEGIQKTVEITRRINERKILKADLMNDWLADDGSGKKILPSTKKLVEKADGSTQMMTFNQMWSNYTKENALFDKEEMEQLTSIASENPDGDNIEIYNGNKYYILPGGKVIFIGKVKK